MGAVTDTGSGVWAATDEGRAMTEEQVPARLREYRLSLRDQRRERRGRANETDPLDGDGDSSEPDWKDQLIERLLAMPPDAFEKLARRLLREAGFVSARVTGRSGDGGIDGIGVYRLSLVSFPVFFQCKRYRGSVRASAVRDFRGAMAGRGDKGLLTTTGSYTREAKDEATRDGAPPIDLIDGNSPVRPLERAGTRREGHDTDHRGCRDRGRFLQRHLARDPRRRPHVGPGRTVGDGL
jgi:restriction system protein